MKAELIGKKNEKGFATLEILIAFAVVILCTGAVIMVAFGNQSVAQDVQTQSEAITKAQKAQESARAKSRQDFDSVLSDASPVSDGIYSKLDTVIDLTACKKQVTSAVTWNAGPRTLSTTLSTFLADIRGALALGSDCPTEPPTSNWDNPARLASDTFNPGKPTSIDVLNKIAYIGSDKAPFFEIADTKGAALGQTDGLFVVYGNGFSLGNIPNSVDVIKWTDSLGNIKKYAFLAMHTNTNQLKVVDVTDIYNPVLVATRALSPCVAGSAPQGWRLYAYKDRLYFLTRFTAGPEFHVFDISTPYNPTELSIGSATCKGFDLGDTAESIEVRDQNISGNTMRFLYLATDEIDKELRVLNVTNPLAITEVTLATQNLAGSQDGATVYIVGNKIYFGRQSSTGADLYVFGITNPTTGLTLLGSKDIGTGVIGIRVAGSLAFLATPKVNKEFQVWNIANLNSISLVKEYNFSNVVEQGIDYEPDFVYATGQSTPNFQILHDNTP